MPLQEVLPKTGLVYSEKGNLNELLCKPKIMPIKSRTLVQLEALEKEIALGGGGSEGGGLAGLTSGRPNTAFARP
jgi:hypothetical protein